MKFKVEGQSCKLLLNEVTVAGSIDVYNAEFDFDESQDGYVKTSVYKAIYDGELQPSATEVILDSDDKAVVPWEELEHPGYLIVGVYGVKGTVRKPTIWSDIITIRGSVDMPSITTEPTPSTYQQILNTYMDVKNTETEIQADFEEFKDDVEEELDEFDGRITAVETSVANAVATANAASATANAASQTAQQAAQTVAGYNTRLTTAEGEIDTLQSEMDAAEADIDALEADVEELDGRLDDLEFGNVVVECKQLPTTGVSNKVYMLFNRPALGELDQDWYQWTNNSWDELTQSEADELINTYYQNSFGD